jgi:hypothetical protein
MTSPASRAARASTPVPMNGAVGRQQRHGLTLHVGAHERAVGVVVLEERDERRGDRDDLLRRHVHVVDLVRVDVRDLAARARTSTFSSRNVPCRRRGVRLRDDVAVLVVGREVLDLVGGARSSTLRYGVSMKPNRLMRAYVER